MRHWIKLVEALNSEDAGRIESPDQRSLAVDPEIDYSNWREILQYPEDYPSVDEAELITKALKASNAEPVSLPGQDKFYITGDEIIIYDGQSVSIKNKHEWLNEVDPEDFFPDHDTKWNNEFWQHPSELYHATTEEFVASIKQEGLRPHDKTRGISNRGVGIAIFTTSEFEDTHDGSYGDFVFEINTIELAKNPNRPYASQEPDIAIGELRDALARKIRCDDYWSEVEGGMSPNTVILHGVVPPQYLTLLDDPLTESVEPSVRLKAEALRNALDAEFPNVSLWFAVTSAGDLHLSMIHVKDQSERNHGLGTTIMQRLLKFCDENKIPMTLTPDKIDGAGQTSIARLTKYYRRFGFGRNKSYKYSGLMIRHPL